MSDIKQIELEGETYQIKDDVARQDIVTLNARMNNFSSFNQLKIVQDAIINKDYEASFQGCCADDENFIYQYENFNTTNGNLYKVNPLTHQLVSMFEGVAFYHGNDLTYKNGVIYAAPAADGSNPSKLICKYNLNSGISSSIDPFHNDSNIVKVVGICSYEDKFIVCHYALAAPVEINYCGFSVFDETNNSYITYTIENNKNFDLFNNTVCGIEVIDHKLYVLTGNRNLIYELLIDDENHKMIYNKVYVLDSFDELHLDIGELEGFTKFPSGDLGTDTLCITSYVMNNAGATGSSCHINLTNLNSDIVPFTHNEDNGTTPRRYKTIYVSRTGGSNLLEDGSSANPFRDICRAVQFANSNDFRNICVGEIQIQDNNIYDVGSYVNTNFTITANNGPTLKIAELNNCRVCIRGSSSNKIKLTANNTTYITNNTNVVLENVISQKTINTSRNANIIADNVDVNIPSGYWLLLEHSTGKLVISSATGVTTNLVNNRKGSLLMINTEFGSSVYTDSYAYKIVTTS